MRKIVCIFLTIIMLVSSAPITVFADDFDVLSSQPELLTAESGDESQESDTSVLIGDIDGDGENDIETEPVYISDFHICKE